MDQAAEVLRQLRLVRRSHFSAARIGDDSRPAAGEGSITASSTSEASVELFESGTWARDAGRSFHYTNSYRWTRLGPAALRLEQIRRGPHHPVHLLDLQPAADSADAWVPIQNHLCREDTYSATLEVEAHRIVLRWSVTGPRKNERIESVYFPEQAPATDPRTQSKRPSPRQDTKL